MNKLVISGIMAGVLIGGILAFMPLLEAAAASLTIDRATINFKQSGDRVMIRGTLEGITPPANADELRITVIISNTNTGEQAIWEGSPTDVQ